MTPVQYRRLAHLARDILPYITEPHWDMENWLYVEKQGYCPAPIDQCGTVACAFGHYLLDKLGYKKANNVLRRESGIRIAVREFGIEYNEATWLFTPDEYTEFNVNDSVQPEAYCDEDITPAMVASRIEVLLAFYE